MLYFVCHVIQEYIKMRINARLDDSYEDKFLYIQQSKKINRTAILKEALDKYFSDEIKQKEQSALRNNQQILKVLSGIATGPEDLSENVKDYLTQSIEKKYDID